MKSRIPTVDLGTTGLTPGVVGLGCMGMSGTYGEVDAVEAERTLQLALDRGVTLLDTADVYGLGSNEEFIGRCIASRRDETHLATKFGIVRGDDGAVLRFDSSPAYTISACDASLKRLGTDHIDLYYQHRPDPDTPIEDTMDASGALVRAGKVRHIGLSEPTSELLRRAHAVHPVAAVQCEWSLWTREFEVDLLPTCRELGVGVVPFCPLGRGFLTDIDVHPETFAHNDMRRFSPRFEPANLGLNHRIAHEVRAMATELGCTSAQLALAWLRFCDVAVVPIPGTKRRVYLEENLGGIDVQLTKEHKQRLDAIAPIGDTAGARTGNLLAAGRVVGTGRSDESE